MDYQSTPWYSDSRFSFFWQHYNTVMSAAHQDAVARAGCVAAQTKAALTNLQYGPYHHLGKQSQQPPRMSRRKKRKKLLKRRQKSNRRKEQQKPRSENQSDTESLYSQMRQGMHINDDNEDVDVTEDFLLFFEQSKKHREEWKVSKFQNDPESSQCAALNMVKVAQDAEPKEHPDVIRRREMKQLYGQASPKLQAMETALQLSFDRNATLYQPQYWPNVPLNVMFNES